MEVSIREVSGRASICRVTVVRGSVSLGSVHEEKLDGELSRY